MAQGLLKVDSGSRDASGIITVVPDDNLHMSGDGNATGHAMGHVGYILVPSWHMLLTSVPNKRVFMNTLQSDLTFVLRLLNRPVSVK